ncbi:hypothetical protein BH10ACT9_BH10ACT9_20300 [soil metagenome]
MRRRTAARRLIASMLLILPSTLAGAVAGVAQAEPVDAADSSDLPDATAVTLPWPTLGLESQLFLGPNSSTSFTVPVPDGLNPARLQGLIHAPMNIGAGYLEIEDGDGRFLAAVDLPPMASAQAVTPFDIDISAARARNASVDLSFAVRPVDNANQFCGPLQQVELSGLVTEFAGAEAPATTISSFFPPVLEQVRIYTPTDADAAEQQSALTMVATLTRLYHPQPLAVAAVSQPRGATPPPAGRFTRAVVVEAGGPAGISVENPGDPGAYLRVSGSGDELTTQVSLLVNQLQGLVQTSAARVDQSGSDTTPGGDTLTFGQLSMTGRTDVLRTGSLRVGADRAALGAGRVESVQVHLLADYTPVPRDDAASVVVRSNDVVVFRAPLDNTGLLDATFDLDSQAFGQWVNLEFALTYTPQQPCGPLIAPITFQIDPRSTLTVQRGGAPLGGFSAVPSEFSPSFMVALDGSGPDQLGYAARVVAAMAHMTTTALTPQVVDLKTAADARSGALIVADSAAIAQTSLNPPIGGDGTTVDIGLPTELRADIEDGLGSIQAFADRPRDRSVVLVTTTGAWTLVDPLFDYVGGLEGGWSQLSGDVLAAGAAGDPTNITIRSLGDTADSASPASMSQVSNQWVPIGIGVAVVAVIAVVTAALWSRRRRTR